MLIDNTITDILLLHDQDVAWTIDIMMGEGRIIPRMYTNIPDEALEEYKSIINWAYASKYIDITTKIISVAGRELDWKTILRRFADEYYSPDSYVVKIISQAWYDVLIASRDYMTQDETRSVISNCADQSLFLREQIINIFADVVNWHYVLRNQTLTESILAKNMPIIAVDRRSITLLCVHQTLYPLVVDTWYKYLDWVSISKRPGLDQDFIEKWIQFLNLDLLFKHQELCDDFIGVYKYSIQSGRSMIPMYQNLSHECIIENCKFFSMTSIFKYQNITCQLICDLAEADIQVHKYLYLLSDNKKTNIHVGDLSGSACTTIYEHVGEEELFDQIGSGKVLIFDNRTGRIKKL